MSLKLRTVLAPLKSWLQIQASFCTDGLLLLLLELLDSEEEGNFLDHQLAVHAGVELELLEDPITAFALNGSLLAEVTHKTSPVTLILSGNYHETITFHVIDAPDTPLVLGHPWLVRRNPHIDWSAWRIIGWSNFCHSVCLQSALSPVDGNSSPSVAPAPPALSNVPPQSMSLLPDALSRQFSSEEPNSALDTIFAPEQVVSMLTWGIKETVREAQQQQPDPSNGPANSLVPNDVHSQVLQRVHTFCFACHPGVIRTTSLLKWHFWLSAMENNMKQFVAACSVCARGKASHRPPAGLLHPLPVHGRPWTHIALDFINSQPVSEGNTAILTIVDRFSTAAHFIALTKPPAAFKTAELLIIHVIRTHGIPSDINCGPWSETPKFGIHSARPSGPLSVRPQVSTPRPTARQRGPTRTWRPPYLCGSCKPQKLEHSFGLG